MKQFVIKAYDGEGKLDKRMEVRPRHFEGSMTKKLFALCTLSLMAALAWGQSPVVKVEGGLVQGLPASRTWSRRPCRKA